MRAFVLSTGRCGSTTFAQACTHLTNYTSGHETRRGRCGEDRFAYPDSHVESDNRLSWLLGPLGERFDPEQTVYVHLTRDRDEVARSYLRRWDVKWRGSIISAYGHGILQRGRWPEEERMDVCRSYVDTVNSNIRAFLRTQPRWVGVRLEHAAEDFPVFLEAIGAEGDLEAAATEWDTLHNMSS